MLTCCPVVVRPPLVWRRVSLPYFLSFALQRALVVQVPVGSLLPYGSQPSLWSHPCGVEAGFILDRNEGLVCSSFPFGLFLRVATTLRDLVTLRVKCVGRFPLVRILRLSVVLSPLPFWMGFVPLSEASLCALSLQAHFLVVLAEAKSLRVFLALSSVLPYPMLWLLVHLHASCSRTIVVLGALP